MSFALPEWLNGDVSKKPKRPADGVLSKGFMGSNPIREKR